MGLFGKIFNSEKKDQTYTGQRPLSSLTQSTGGADYYDKIRARMEGRGVGYGDDYASVYSSPIIKNMRSQFTDYQLPELKSELSVMGRRTGSGGSDTLRRAYNEQGLQEGDIFSRLQQRNEDAKREDVNNAIEGVGNFARNDANIRNNSATFEKGLHGEEIQAANQRRANEAAGLQNAVYAGSDIASAYFGGGQGPGNRQAPTLPQYSNSNQFGDMNKGFGQSGNSINQRLAQRAKMGQRGGV